MDLRTKIGQLIACGFSGTTLTPTFQEMVRKLKIGNFILFTHNIESLPQLAHLCQDLQDLALEATGYPAFITIDQEGGVVTRLPKDAANVPGAMAIAATNNPHNAFIAGQITGRELRALGIQINLAPCVDINSNPHNPVIGVRSYGEDKETVATYANEMIRGMQSTGTLACAKHFPGHGDTAVDSHLGLPTVNKTLEELEALELVPFKSAIDAGVACMMSSHILFPKIEKENVPCTMSRTILTDILRDRLGFQGLILTDCLEMAAIQEHYGTPQGAAAAVHAGANMVFVTHSMELCQQACDLIHTQVEDGTIPLPILEDSVRRIIHAKDHYSFANPDVALAGLETNHIAVQGLMEKSLTLVRGEVPLADSTTLFIGSLAYRATIASSRVDGAFGFPGYLASAFEATPWVTPVNPTKEDIAAAITQAAGHNQVILGLYNAQFNQGQLALCQALVDAGHQVTCVALRNPYELGLIPPAATAIAAYEYTTLSFDALIRLFRGEIACQGKPSFSLHKM